MNKCFFTGHVTRDIELRYTQANNTAVAKFSIAVDSGYGDKKRTDFFNMTAWGKSAEALARLVKKGTKLVLECQAVQNQYKDKNGNNVNTVDFTVQNWEFAESKNASQHNTQERPQSMPQNSESDFMVIPDGLDSELPFA